LPGIRLQWALLDPETCPLYLLEHRRPAQQQASSPVCCEEFKGEVWGGIFTIFFYELLIKKWEEPGG
jgi:hypothetical protein